MGWPLSGTRSQTTRTRPPSSTTFAMIESIAAHNFAMLRDVTAEDLVRGPSNFAGIKIVSAPSGCLEIMGKASRHMARFGGAPPGGSTVDCVLSAEPSQRPASNTGNGPVLLQSLENQCVFMTAMVTRLANDNRHADARCSHFATLKQSVEGRHT